MPSTCKPMTSKNTNFRFIGQPIPRTEDARLLIGRGQFSDDFGFPGQTYAAMVRSPHAHARIVRVDTAAAKKMPGVIGVFTGSDCFADGLDPIPHDPLPKTKYDMKLRGPGSGEIFFGPHLLLPTDKARHVGEAVAMVVAETLAQALDAAEAVAIEYDVLPCVTLAEEAMQPGAPAVWDEVRDNILVDTHFGNTTETDRVLAQAPHVVSIDHHIGRVTGVPIEPRTAVAQFDKAVGRYTIYAGSGGAVRQKRELATVLGVDPDKIRVLSFDVGGNFGTRNRVYVEFGLVLWAARKLDRPVKYTATRSECFVSDYQGRDLVAKFELALDERGRFLALRATNISNAGARCVSLSPLSKGAGLITGSYDIPVASLRAVSVFSNTVPTQAYRSSGRPEITFALERLIDMAARKLGIDRIALRRRNLVRPKAMPYRNAIGMLYDSGRYEENMDLAMRLADWDGFKARRREARKRGKLLGLGLANYIESSIGAPKEQTQLKVGSDGHVDVVIGTQPSGQGHETSFAQVISDLIAVPVETVRIIFGDTDIVKVGGGSHSGRSMRHAATVFSLAAKELIAKGTRAAAVIFGTTPDRVDFNDGRFSSRDTNRSFDFLELARVMTLHKMPDDLSHGLVVVADNEMHDPVFPNGCAICEIEIDPESCGLRLVRYTSVDDVGRCINPLIVDGQTHGAIVQGVGQALWEQCVVDPAGQPLCGSLMDYGMPRSDSVPSFVTRIVEVLSPTNPLGIKAGGEGGTTAAPAVIVSAVADALAPYGIDDIRMPVTPYRIWQAIKGRKNATSNPMEAR
ncbi:MAG: xanthine dehydrogenase family protein molybdopterin-binding subunit [Pseudolabrys sp.]